ncbi:MAG: YigZ family protein, partial [Cytophagales bacterium]|nr:YigZ family protein [Cytophagales bacterium]
MLQTYSRKFLVSLVSDRFFTIQSATSGEYKEKGSKFLAFAFSVSSEAEIKVHLDNLRKEYYDARHHCYAYVLGLENQSFRANDDGEPGHSAGDPILGQIRSFKLTNCLIVVVRYFGGTKLGVGGLVNAYKTAATGALSKSKKIEIIGRLKIDLKFDYPSSG